MKRTPFLSSRRRLRRLAVLGAGAVLGLGGVLAIAAPASAHHSVVNPTAECDTTTGEWVVTWKVDSVAPADVHHYKLVQVNATPADSPVSNITVTTDDTYPHEVGTPLVGTQRVPGSAHSASLAVKAKWENGFQEHKAAYGKIKFGEKCEKDKPKPNASFESACDGSVTVTLTNDGKVPAKFTVIAGDFRKDVAVEAGKSEQVVVPAEAAAEIVVKSGRKLFKGGFEAPQDCAPVKVAAKSDCDSLTIAIENPKGNAAAEATLTPKGGEAQTVTVAAGETKEVKFDASEGTVVTVTIGEDSTDVAWEAPEDCASPAPSTSPAPGAGGGGPTLPVTGASIGTAVGIAAVLLAAGTGLFFFFRRRRIRFTA